MALREILRAGPTEVAALLTTLTEDFKRVSMHGVREELVERQAESLGFPLEKVYIPADSSNEEYERRMGATLARWKARGVRAVVFGDLFLEDVRRYRGQKLAAMGMEAVFPLWGRDPRRLAADFVQLGFRAVVTCVDTRQLDGSFAGRDYDTGFLAELPPRVDPCGENGEFHTFVHSGPLFPSAIAHRKGELVLRENRFLFCDVLPPAALE